MSNHGGRRAGMPRNGEATDAGEATRKVHPAFIYAFEKLGFLVSEQNAHTFSAEDIAAWNAAVAEGEERYGAIED
jgi:hypothetical protein